jgi:hypothetical protein
MIRISRAEKAHYYDEFMMIIKCIIILIRDDINIC